MSAENMQNLAVWMDIPVVDLDRSIQFYKEVIGREISKESFGDLDFAVFMHESGNGACLVPDETLVSEDRGILVYFNVDGRIRDAVEMAKQNGGKVIEDTHAIGPHGFRALLVDSEGNGIAVHSNTDS